MHQFKIAVKNYELFKWHSGFIDWSSIFSLKKKNEKASTIYENSDHWNIFWKSFQNIFNQKRRNFRGTRKCEANVHMNFSKPTDHLLQFLLSAVKNSIISTWFSRMVNFNGLKDAEREKLTKKKNQKLILKLFLRNVIRWKFASHLSAKINLKVVRCVNVTINCFVWNWSFSNSTSSMFEVKCKRHEKKMEFKTKSTDENK